MRDFELKGCTREKVGVFERFAVLNQQLVPSGMAPDQFINTRIFSAFKSIVVEINIYSVSDNSE
jgi:hypothetical protein